jgi:hypothetical protein
MIAIYRATFRQYLFLTRAPLQRAAWTHVWSASLTNTISHDLVAGIFGRSDPRRSIFGSHEGYQ